VDHGLLGQFWRSTTQQPLFGLLSSHSIIILVDAVCFFFFSLASFPACCHLVQSVTISTSGSQTGRLTVVNSVSVLTSEQRSPEIPEIMVSSCVSLSLDLFFSSSSFVWRVSDPMKYQHVSTDNQSGRLKMQGGKRSIQKIAKKKMFFFVDELK
jgi:hypothetical protein